MSAITFPNNPTPGTQTTVNGITYTFTDGTWVAVGQSNFYSLPIASPTVLGGIKGGGTDITVANDGVISFSGTLPGPKTFTFTVTGNGQTSVTDPQTGLTGAIGDYTITGSDRRGIVDGTNPTIHINEEDTIIFNVTAAGQEFRLVWATAAPTSGPNVGGFEDIGTNSTSNEATGQGSGTVTWVSKEQDGDSLYQGGSNYYYQDCDQNFTNNPTTYKFGTIKVFHKDTPEGKSDWLELNDTPNSYAGQAGKFTKVNAGENALEFTDSPVSDIFTGATNSADGTTGLVIQPVAGDEGKYLKGDGSWDTVTSGSTTTINSNGDNRLITGSATPDTLNAESNITFDGNNLKLENDKKVTFGSNLRLEVYTDGTTNYVKSAADGSSPGAFPISIHSGPTEVITIDDGATEIKTGLTAGGDITVKMGLKDKDSELGTNGQVLTSTGTQVDWVDASTLSTSSSTPAFQSSWRIPL